MLVLTRKPGEKIVVGNDDNLIEIVSVERGLVRFAFYVREPITLMPGNIEVDLGDSLSTEGAPRHVVKVSRKVDDSVLIGQDPRTQIEVLVVSVKGEAVRVGVKAPRDVQVHREEIFELNRRQMLEAARMSGTELDPEALRRLLEQKNKDAAQEDDEEDSGSAGSNGKP